MKIDFDATITLGTIGSILIFIGGLGLALFKLGTYISTLNSLLGKYEHFMEESAEDRKDLRKRIDKGNGD